MPIRKGDVVQSAPNVASHLAVGPEGLPENVKFERRPDGSVWRVETLPEANTGPDRKENRVDSDADRDIIAKGGTPWYDEYITADEPVVEAPKPQTKPKSPAKTKGAKS